MLINGSINNANMALLTDSKWKSIARRTTFAGLTIENRYLDNFAVKMLINDCNSPRKLLIEIALSISNAIGNFGRHDFFRISFF